MPPSLVLGEGTVHHLDRSLRTGALVAGVILGALIGFVLQVGAPIPESLLLMATVGFFSGVPLGYLSTTRADGLRLAVLGAGGVAIGTLLTAAGVGIALKVPLGSVLQAASTLAAIAGLTTLLFLTLGALLGRRAGTRRPHAPAADTPEARREEDPEA